MKKATEAARRVSRPNYRRLSVSCTAPTIDVVAIGARIRERREAKGFAATQLDELAGVGRGTTHRLEHGDRPEIALGVVARIAVALGVSIDWLAFGARRRAPRTANPAKKLPSSKRTSRK